MLVPRMDLLDSPFLDKMNSNIGRLRYEDESRTPTLPSAVPSKRKYGEEHAVERMSCGDDDDHVTKMSRLFASQLARPSAGDGPHEPWGHSPVEDSRRPYASVSGYAADRPLPLTKSGVAAGGRERSAAGGPVERQQNRPSVITCAPANNRNCRLSHCHMNGCPPGPAADHKTNACDPVIEEHFRRSLGQNYREAASASNSVSITGSVDDHFAKALGDAWLQIKTRGGGGATPEADP